MRRRRGTVATAPNAIPATRSFRRRANSPTGRCDRRAQLTRRPIICARALSIGDAVDQPHLTSRANPVHAARAETVRDDRDITQLRQAAGDREQVAIDTAAMVQDHQRGERAGPLRLVNRRHQRRRRRAARRAPPWIGTVPKSAASRRARTTKNRPATRAAVATSMILRRAW